MPERFETEQQLANQQEIDLGELADPPFAFDNDLAAASALPDLPDEATKAVVCVSGADVRWRPDGATTPPTAAVGMLVPAGSTVVFAYGNPALAAIRLIEVSAGARIDVVYGT